MDIRLIRANIALAQDDRLEVMRLLDEYNNDPHKSDENEPLVLWLEAHAQTDHNALIRHMEKLLKRTPPYDPYHQMAHDYLWKEDTYADTIADVQRQSRAIPGLTWRRAIGSAVALMASIVLISFLFNLTSNPPDDTIIVPTLIPLDTPIPTLLPNNSQALNINDHLARYEGGLLMVAALEDDSVRVLDEISGERLQPVAGARFYVLELQFECRQGICDKPPQAELSLVLENDFTVQPREGATVQNGHPMSPIALGRRTTGWVVFEVPVVSQPVELFIRPLDMQGRDDPLTIELPSTDSP